MTSKDDMLVQKVVKIIDNTLDRRGTLQLELNKLQQNKEQLESSSQEAVCLLRVHFEDLKCRLSEAIDNRRMVLEKEIEKEETEAKKLVEEGIALIEVQLKQTAELLRDGKDLLASMDFKNSRSDVENSLQKFLQQHSVLDSKTPLRGTKEECSISVNFPQQQTLVPMLNTLADYARVYARPCVFITNVLELPAALHVFWQLSDVGEMMALNVFRLQIKKEIDIDFEDVYEGRELDQVLRHLQVGCKYCLRLCARSDDSLIWSPYSTTVVAHTSICSHEWQLSDVDSFEKNEEGWITKTNSFPSILYTKSASYTSGSSVMLKMLVIGQTNEHLQGFGLSALNTNLNVNLNNPIFNVSYDAQNDIGFLRLGTFFCSLDGRIFIDGLEKTTRLPALSNNSCLTFQTESLSSNKLRVTAEISDKIATFDWSISDQCGANKEDTESNLFRNEFDQSDGKMSHGKSLSEVRLYIFARLSSLGCTFCIS